MRCARATSPQNRTRQRRRSSQVSVARLACKSPCGWRWCLYTSKYIWWFELGTRALKSPNRRSFEITSHTHIHTFYARIAHLHVGSTHALLMLGVYTYNMRAEVRSIALAVYGVRRALLWTNSFECGFERCKHFLYADENAVRGL